MVHVQILKIVEIIQYSIIFFFLTAGVSYVLNKHAFTETEEEIKKMSKFKLTLSILSQLIILSIMMFTIRKLAMLIPSIATLMNGTYEAYSTHEYTVHIALVFFFLEMTESIKLKLRLFREILN